MLMKIRDFIQCTIAVEAMLAAELAMAQGPVVPLLKPTSSVNIPFDVDGTPLEVSKTVDYEYEDVCWTTYSDDFLTAAGAVVPIKTYRGEFKNVLDSLDSDSIKALLNPVQTPAVDASAE